MQIESAPVSPGDAAIRVMKERGIDRIWWGDTEELEDIARLSGKKFRNQQELRTRIIDMVLRDARFRKFWILHNRHHCRGFRLVEESHVNKLKGEKDENNNPKRVG